jgi:hypothetical protein
MAATQQRGRGTRRRSPDAPCLNCGDTTRGRYCPECGQAKREVVVSVRAMVMDVLEDQLVLNKALPRTLLYLLFRPGRLTIEYINGRIVRYIAPFRLYLVTSVVFFLLLSLVGLQMLERVTTDIPQQAAAAADSTLARLEPHMPALDALDTLDMPPEARLQLEALRAEIERSRAAQSRRASADAEDAAVDSARTAADSAGSAAATTAADSAGNVAGRAVDSERSATADSAGNAARRAADALPDGVQPWARNLQVDFGSNELNDRVKARAIERFGHLPSRQAAREFLRQYSEYLPHMVFFLLPLFAFILKLLYIRRRRYYAEHFVFALHVHAFVFMMFILMLAFRNTNVNLVLAAWTAVYTWLAMKKVYGQGIFRTTIKYATLGFAYSFALTIALALTVVVTLLLL